VVAKRSRFKRRSFCSVLSQVMIGNPPCSHSRRESGDYSFPRVTRQVPRALHSQWRAEPKNIAALHTALGGLPDKMRIEAD
jgi:hypothetical protein